MHVFGLWKDDTKIVLVGPVFAGGVVLARYSDPDWRRPLQNRKAVLPWQRLT